MTRGSLSCGSSLLAVGLRNVEVGVFKLGI